MELSFIKCLSESVEVKMDAGRSRSRFYRTQNRRFIIKSLKPAEVPDFTDPTFASNYFAYMNKCLQEGKPTTLCKIFGVFKVSFRNSDRTCSFDLIVMEDLFYGRECSRRFDLKVRI